MPISTLRLLSEQWRRHVLTSVCFGLLCTFAWLVGNTYLVIGLSAFWISRFVRDIQWYRMLAREWESTKELLDWEKIERLAA